MIKYFSAFAGIGGFDLGIERAIPDSICAGYSEVDRHAIKIYEKHYPDRINYGDIRKIKTKDLPDFDLFCGGFPCQDVSIAGKRKGLCGARSGLFFEIIRIVRKKQPRYILLENVKGLLSSNKGWDFARILVELGDAGYSVEWAVYNSKNFGVPQNRQRVFIIGYPGRDCGSKIFPIGEGTGNFNESGEQPERELVSNAIDSNYYKGPDGKRQLIAIGHTRDKSGKASYHPLELFGTIKQPSGNQTNYVICDSGFSRQKQVRTEVMPPRRANTGAAYNNIVGSIRRLTPLECERLQGFPDRFSEGISDTQRYRCLGNAVTVNVIEAVMTAIREKGGL